MTSTPPPPSNDSDARTPLTPDELSQALDVHVYDREGNTKTLGELVHGQRSALVFIRHYWCVNCQAYVRYMSAAIPPSNLPPNTQILVIGCGSYQPIDAYAAASSSKYPIYTDPTNSLHAILKFKWTLLQGETGEGMRDYMRDAGSTLARIWGGVKYALGHIQDINYVGPKSLNGGEVVLGADGKCDFIHRMQNTEDHTNVAELASLLGAKYTETGEKLAAAACGDSCAVDANKA